MARPKRNPPSSFSGDWPTSPCSDPVAETARLFAVNLRVALDGRSLRWARDVTGVDHTVVADIINGASWPDLATIARLEHGLGVDLWPVWSSIPETGTNDGRQD